MTTESRKAARDGAKVQDMTLEELARAFAAEASDAMQARDVDAARRVARLAMLLRHVERLDERLGLVEALAGKAYAEATAATAAVAAVQGVVVKAQPQLAHQVDKLASLVVRLVGGMSESAAVSAADEAAETGGGDDVNLVSAAPVAAPAVTAPAAAPVAAPAPAAGVVTPAATGAASTPRRRGTA